MPWSALSPSATAGKVCAVFMLAPCFGELAMLKHKGYLSVKEAAECLGVSPNTVRAWGADGKIPEYRHPVNNYRLYKRDDLQEVINQLEKSVARVARN